MYFTQHCLVWCLVVYLWLDCFPLRSPTKLVHEKQHIISELERVAPKYLPSNQFTFIYLAFPTQGKKTQKQKNTTHNTNHKKISPPKPNFWHPQAGRIIFSMKFTILEVTPEASDRFWCFRFDEFAGWVWVSDAPVKWLPVVKATRSDNTSGI